MNNAETNLPPTPKPKIETPKASAAPAPQTPDPKPQPPKVFVLPSGKLTEDGLSLLETGLSGAAEAIADGLRQFIHNQIELGQAQRGALENAFEAARTAQRKRPTVGDLTAARAAVETLAVLLANHTVRDTQALPRVKAVLQRTEKIIITLTPA